VVRDKFRVGSPYEVYLKAGYVVAPDYRGSAQKKAFAGSSGAAKEYLGRVGEEYFSLFGVEAYVQGRRGGMSRALPSEARAMENVEEEERGPIARNPPDFMDPPGAREGHSAW